MRLIYSLLGCATTAMSLSVAAATAPDAGQSLQSIEQQPLQQPSQNSLDLNLPDAPEAPTIAGGPTLQVNGFVIEGNPSIPEAQLQELLADLKGRNASLGEIQAATRRITLLYRERGYPLARAYLPAQTIDGGIVKINVLEGRYGQVSAQNSSRAGGLALAPLQTLQAGETVRADELIRSLLLLQDVPGTDIKSTLKPGASTGTTDLLVDVRPGPLLSGAVDADNYGNRFVGEYRLGGTLNVNNPLGLGDILSLRAVGSDEDQHYGRIGYQTPVTRWATQLGVAYSDMDYQLGKDFEDLHAHGNARITSVYAIQPLIRSKALSLSTQLQFDDKRLKDDIDQASDKSDKHSRVVTLSFNGSGRDDFLGGGLTSFSLAWSSGSLNIDGQAKQMADSQTAGTQGQFNKVVPSLVRLQRLTDRFSLYTQLQGQWADTNLDSSEQLYLGGAYGVRAYPQGEAAGDQGWLANVELRYALTDAWQLSTFVDHGDIRTSKNPWTSGDNHRSLSGTGLGATWSAYGWRINAVAAWKLGNADAESDVERSPRVWAQVVRSF